MAQQVYDKEPDEDAPSSGPKSLQDFLDRDKANRAADAKNDEKLRGFWRENKEDYGAPEFGTADRTASRRVAGMIWKRKRLLGLGVVGGILMAMFAFSGLFSTFKMNHLMDNIDQRAFARLSAGIDTRNTAFLRTYMELRLGDICPSGGTCDHINLDKDNLFFKASEVQRGNPIFNWYRTIRSSNFEKEVFNKNGIFITGGIERNSKGVLVGKTAVFQIKNDQIKLPDNVEAMIREGRWGEFTKLVQEGGLKDFFDVKVFTANSERRAAIKQVVKDNTQWWQVYKRRQLRKDIASKTGTNKWRFFDDSRQKIDTKKVNIRNRLIDAITPSDTKTGVLIDCLFGIKDCKIDPDPQSPANSDLKAGDVRAENVDIPQSDQAKAASEGISKGVDFTTTKEVVQKSLGAFAGILDVANWAGVLSSLAHIDQNISSGALAAQVAIARGMQALALYQTFETIRDQMKTGQLTSDEVNQFMQTIATFSASEAWIKVVEGKGDPKTLAATAGVAAALKYCDSKNTPSADQFAYLCPDKVIGGASGAKELQTAYMNGIGKVLHPLLSGYQHVFGWFGDAFNSIFGKILSPAFKLVQSFANSIPGVGSNLKNFFVWAAGKMAVILGSAPIYSYANGNLAPAGQLASGVIQGSAWAGETSSRQTGASLSTPDSIKTATANTIGYLEDQSSSQSFFTKYLSASNQNSALSNGLFALSQIKLSSLGNIFSNTMGLINKLPAQISSLLSGRVSAASSNYGYTAAQMAEIKTYDFPAQCYNRDPLSESPSDGTNLASVLRQAGGNPSQIKLTWSLVTDSNTWYNYIEGPDQFPELKNKVPLPGDPSKTDPTVTYAMEVYNCNLLDNSVMGGLGYLYGYTKDHGYQDSNDSNGGGGNPGGSLPTGTSRQLAQKLVPYVNNGTIQCKSPTGRDINCSDITNSAKGVSIKGGVGCDVNALSPGLLGMLLQLVNMGHSFTLSALCSDHSNTGTAGPGHSTGQAADFNTIDGVFMGPDDVPWSAAKIQAGENLDQDIASFMPKSTGFGQIQCHPVFDFLSGFVTFNDTCHHQHVQVAS